MNAPRPQADGLTLAGLGRSRPRVPFQRPAEVRTAVRSWRARVLDLSVHGAFVALPLYCRLEPGERLTLLVGTSEGTVELHGAVVRQRSSRVMLRCAGIAPADAARLRSLVARELGDPALADRTLDALI